MRLIDADSLIESMGISNAVKWGNKDRNQQALSYGTLMNYEIKDYIDTQPIVDAEPVMHGRWADYGHCSCCGWGWSDLVYDRTEQMSHMNYCPCCGAKMDLEEQDEADRH